jgi:DNA-binding NarL/FixJ family response regulator
MQVKILIVETEAITAMDLKNTLENMEFEVVSTVSTGKEAILKAEELKPDILLMDMALNGEMDSSDTAHEIMTLFDIPVIFLTAFLDEKTIYRSKLIEPSRFITKPIEYDELKTSIESAIYEHSINLELKEK